MSLREQRHEFCRLYRLYQVMVEAGLPGCVAIARLTVSGQRDETHSRMACISANAPRDFEPVHFRKSHVEDDEVRGDFIDEAQRRDTVRRIVADESCVA